MEALLHDLYYTQHNYDGVSQLYKKAHDLNHRITRTVVKDWLDKQTAHQQTKVSAVGKKKYLPIYSETPYAFQIDLTFFPRYGPQNDNFTVLFTAINVNTRFAYAFASENAGGNIALNCIEKLAEKTVINSISCDSGKEFNNKGVLAYCKKEKITLYFITDDSHKLGIMNRFHRTIKEKLTKFFIGHNTVRWLDIMPKIITNYNKTVNRGIGVAPIKVTNAMEADIIAQKREQSGELYEKLPDFVVGDKVRLRNKKVLFADKQLPKFSSSVYTVIKVYGNSADILKHDGNKFKVKKSQMQKIPDGEEVLPQEPNALERANKLHKQRLKMRREGLY